jgi:hypothetical protein
MSELTGFLLWHFTLTPSLAGKKKPRAKRGFFTTHLLFASG